MPARDITLSVVSHRQNTLVNQLLEDVGRVCADRLALVLTENMPDETPLAPTGDSVPVERIANAGAKGFGANHNAAFARCRTPYFAVCNPDIRLLQDPFPPLLDSLGSLHAACAGPLVRSPGGKIEDSARRFPTAGSLLGKLFSDPGAPDYPADRGALEVDWCAGMFLLLRSEDFRAAGGFDEAYFLYYEDVDLCRRLHNAGKTVVYNPAAEVVHEARRGSRREPRLALHHLASMLRFLSTR